jgi:hypothetical protein
MGYSTDLVYAPRFLLVRYRVYKEQVGKFLDLLSTSKPLRLSGGPSYDLQQATVKLPGPITREYTVVNEPIPATSRIVTADRLVEGNACVVAKIKFSYNIRGRSE